MEHAGGVVSIYRTWRWAFIELRRIYLVPFRRATVKSVVTAVTLLLPVLFEQVGTIPPPLTMREWAVHEIRDVCQFILAE
jgi:predicted Ser/Thr protein kinase